MGLTVTRLGRGQTTPPSATTSATLSSIAPTPGSLLVACGIYDMDANDSNVGTISMSDTFNATGKGTWTQGPTCIRSPTAPGAGRQHAEVWTLQMGSAPGTGNVTITMSTTPLTSGWIWVDVYQVEGQSASPLGQSTGSTNRQAAGPTTFTDTLGGAPASDSAVFSPIYCDNGTTPGTKPTGWTDGQIDAPAWGACAQSAYINGGSATAPQWTALLTGADYVSSALEIKSANSQVAPGVRYVKEVGFVTNTTGGTTSAITVATGGVPVGDCIVIYGSCDNTGTNGVATTIAVADNSSQSGSANTYTLQTNQAIADPGAASAGIQGFFVVCIVTRALLASDTITITYGNSTAAKAINAQQFAGVRRDVPVLASSYAVQDNQTAQSVSVATGVAVARVGQAVCALVSVEGGTADTFTQDTDTAGGVWVELTRRGSGTTTSGSTLNSVYKIPNATGTQTYDHATMLGTSRDHCAAILILDAAPTADPQARLRRRIPLLPQARKVRR